MPDSKPKIDPNHVFPINGSEFFCQFKLKSADSYESDKGGSINLIDFTKSAIVSLDIVDSIFEPFISGSITVNNPFDFIEDNVQLRGDGKDILEVTLYDVEDEKQAQDRGTKTSIPYEQRKLKYKFVIQDENNDVSKTDRSNNFKTYSLIDVDYHKLNEAVPYGKKYSGMVGDIIKQILEEFGFEIHPTKWSPGNHLIEKFPEFIIPPAGWRYSDLIKYLIRIYYTDEGDESLAVQGILKQERATDDKESGKFTLQPLTTIFSDNKKLTQEAFAVGDLTDSGIVGSMKARGRKHYNSNNPLLDLTVPVNRVTGALKNANLTSPMTRFTNQFFVNYTVSTHDPQTGMHTKDIIVIEDIKKKWTDAFVEVFQCEGGKPKPNLYLDRKDENIYKPYVMPFRQHAVKSLATAQMVSNLLFLNLQLGIDNIGSTHRKAGKFIDVFRLNTKIKGELSKSIGGAADSKLLGRWFVTTLRHRFFKDKYQNVIQCVKPCVGPDSFAETDLINLKTLEGSAVGRALLGGQSLT